MGQAKPIGANSVKHGEADDGRVADHSGWAPAANQYRLNQPHDHTAQRFARR